MPERTADRWQRQAVLLFLITLTYYFVFLRVLWRVGDEGTLVYGAQLVAEGSFPYRDFVEPMWPGSFYWLALFFKVFGASWIVARGVLLFTGAISTLLIYWMSRRLHSGATDILAALFWMVISIPVWPATSHHWDSNFFGLLSAGAYFLWQDTGRKRHLLMAGILAGLTTCFIQQKGFLIVGAYIITSFFGRNRSGGEEQPKVSRVWPLIAGYSIVCFMVLFYFLQSGNFSALIYSTLIWPSTGYHKVNVVPYGFGLSVFFWEPWYKALQTLFPLSIGIIAVLLFIIPFLIIFVLPFLCAGLAVISRCVESNWRKVINPKILAYWVIGIAFWLSEIHRPDIIHLIYGSPFFLILLFFQWDMLFEKKRFLYSAGIGIVIIAITLFGALHVTIPLSASNKISTRRGTMYSFQEDLALKFLQTEVSSKQEVFIYPYYPMYYFLADVKNPTRYSVYQYGFYTDDQFLEAISDLKRKKVKYILWDTYVEGENLRTWFPGYVHPLEENLLMEQYIKKNYQFLGMANKFRIMRLIED